MKLHTVVGVLNELKKSATASKGKEWAAGSHVREPSCAHPWSIHVATEMIKAYGKCGCMLSARRVFDSFPKPTLALWNTLILGYAANGQGETALGFFRSMKGFRGCKPDSFTYVAVLKACTTIAANGAKQEALEQGRAIHIEAGQRMNRYVQNTLIDMYASCGSMEEARKVFDALTEPNVVSWNALLRGYAENGQGSVALNLFAHGMNGCEADGVTFVACLRACASIAPRNRENALESGRRIHRQAAARGHLDRYVQSALIDMYAKCGSMADALWVFNCAADPDVVCCNSLLSGYSDNGKEAVALQLFSWMRKSHGCSPNPVTYVVALKSCTSLAAKGEKEKACKLGQEIHRSVVGCNLNPYVLSTLIEMYATCGEMAYAQGVFDDLQNPNVKLWNALLRGYVENSEGGVALSLYSRMKRSSGCSPDAATYVAVLRACAALAANGEKAKALRQGKEIHLELGCDREVHVLNTLIDMYAKCSSMVDAQRVFDSLENPDVVSWTVLLLGYADNNAGRVALDLFDQMTTNCIPDAVAYVAALKACNSLAMNGEKAFALQRGKGIHSRADCCHLSDPYVQNTLIDMYAKCGSMADAQHLFDAFQKRDAVSWTALLHGYADNGEGEAVLRLFSRMKAECEPDAVTYVSVFKACSLIGALALGRKLHAEMSEVTPPATCLVDFYAKCGSMVEACEAYDLLPRTRDLSTLSALLSGYAQFGDSEFVFSLFDAQKDAGFILDAVTFLCVLACCSHAGLLKHAKRYFEEVPLRYRVNPDVRHYTCMVDVLGRSNQLSEAIDVIQAMPCQPDTVTWMTLLGACLKWKNAEIGSWAFQSLVNLDDKHGPSYVVMAQIYGVCGMLEEQERVLEMRKSTRKLL